MEALVSTKAAVLQALMGGPRYGRDLIRVLGRPGPTLVNPRPGTIYRAAESLARRRLLQTWTVVPGGRRGARSRRYYELTPAGIAMAEAQRKALRALIGTAAVVRPGGEERRMAERLRRAAELSAFALRLQRGLRSSE